MAKNQQWSLDFVFESGVEGTNHWQQVFLPPIGLQLPSPLRRTQSSIEPMVETRFEPVAVEITKLPQNVYLRWRRIGAEGNLEGP
jgi:hypothetical protein